MGLGSALFGSGGKSKTIQYPTIDLKQNKVEDLLYDFLRKSGNASAQKMYTGQLASGPSRLEQLSLAGLENEARQLKKDGGDKTTQAASEALMQILNSGPTDISSFITNSIENPLTEIFQKNRAGVAGRFADNFFGSQRDTADAKNFEDFSNALSNSVADAALKAREFDIQSKIDAAGIAPQIAQSDSQIFKTLLEAGAVPREIQDAKLKGQYQKYQDWQNRRGQFAELMLKFIGTPTRENITTTKGATKGLLGGLAEGVGQGVGMAGGAAAGAAIFSDRRLKNNIKFIGEHSGHRWYSYDIGGRREVGVMAQEVRETHPEAVSLHESGYLMVDYSKL